MPVEDWIETYAQLQAKEMERIERSHSDRMCRIEKLIDDQGTKIDNLSDKMDRKINEINVTLTELRNEMHEKNINTAVNFTEIKTKMAVYTGIISVVTAGIVAWVTNFFSK